MSLAQQSPTASAFWNQPVVTHFGRAALPTGALAVVAASTPSSSPKRGREDGHTSEPPSSKQKVNDFSPPPTFHDAITIILSKKISRSSSQQVLCMVVRAHLNANMSASKAGWLSEQVEDIDASHYRYVVDVDGVTLLGAPNEAGQYAREERERTLAQKDEAARDAIERRSAQVLEDVREDLREAKSDVAKAKSEVATLRSRVGRRDVVIKDFDRALDARKAVEECIRSVEVLRETVLAVKSASLDAQKVKDLNWRSFGILAYQLTGLRNVPLFPGYHDPSGTYVKPKHLPGRAKGGFETDLLDTLLNVAPWVINASTHALIVHDALKEERLESAHPNYTRDYVEKHSLLRKHRSSFELSRNDLWQHVQLSLRTKINRDPLQTWKPQQFALDP